MDRSTLIFIDVEIKSHGFKRRCISSFVVEYNAFMLYLMIYAVFYYGNVFVKFQLKKLNFNLFITLQKEKMGC